MLLTDMLDIDEYQLLGDAYTGGGGFADGSYLIAHKREDEAKFLQRKKLSYYSNFVHPVVDALTNPIFRKAVIRDFKSSNDQMLANFRDDVDGKGTSINAFMKKAAKLARLYGVVFIIEDNFPEEAMPKDKKSAAQMRLFPYLYLVKPQQVKDYVCDQMGVLESISFQISTAYSKATGKVPDQEKLETWTWTRTEWIKGDKDGKEIARGEHNIGEVPVIPLFSVEASDGELLPVSPMLAIAQTNKTIFNLNSELREILRNQAFSVLIFPVTRDIHQQIVEKGLTVGSDNALPYPAESSRGPDFIAPSSEPAVLLQNEIKRLVDDIYRQASLSSVVAVQTKQSGVAKQWDFEQTNQSLAEMAESCEAAETAIFKLFGKWANVKIKELKIKYDRDFGIVDVTDELDKAQRVKDLDIGPVVNREVSRKISEIYFSDIDDQRYKEVIAEIESRAQDASQEKVFA